MLFPFPIKMIKMQIWLINLAEMKQSTSKTHCPNFSSLFYLWGLFCLQVWSDGARVGVRLFFCPTFAHPACTSVLEHRTQHITLLICLLVGCLHILEVSLDTVGHSLDSQGL